MELLETNAAVFLDLLAILIETLLVVLVMLGVDTVFFDLLTILLEALFGVIDCETEDADFFVKRGERRGTFAFTSGPFVGHVFFLFPFFFDNTLFVLVFFLSSSLSSCSIEKVYISIRNRVELKI